MDDDLFHYGIKGMKWGVRKARRKEKRQKHKSKKDILEEMKSLSVEELNERSRRMEAENRYLNNMGLSKASNAWEKIPKDARDLLKIPVKTLIATASTKAIKKIPAFS